MFCSSALQVDLLVSNAGILDVDSLSNLDFEKAKLQVGEPSLLNLLIQTLVHNILLYTAPREGPSELWIPKTRRGQSCSLNPQPAQFTTFNMQSLTRKLTYTSKKT